MQLILAGCIGFGLVWGWLLVLVGAHGGKRPWRTRIILALTTLLPIILIFWQFGWQQLFAFALAMAFTICLHLGWRRQLATGKTA